MIKVIGIGDNVVDKYIHTGTMYPGGNALNFSAYAKQLGADSAYLGTFGKDKAASHIIKVLTELKIDITRCRQADGENGFARVNLVDGDRVFLVGNKGGVQKDNPIILSSEDMEYIKNFDIVHTSCYSYNMENEIIKIKAAGIPIAYDFSNNFNSEFIEKVCPNVDFSFFSCSHMNDDEIKKLLKQAHDLGSSFALGTAGSRGAILCDGKDYYIQKPNLVKAIDTLGAGDSFITAFLLNYIGNYKNEGINKKELIEDSLAKGALFASKTCMVNGAFGYGEKF